MTAYTSVLSGQPTAGYFVKGDTYTDSQGVIYTCIQGGQAAYDGTIVSSKALWVAAPSGTDQKAGSQLYTTQNALTAFAGGGQASGTPITADIARFTIVASANDSGKMPAALAGRCVTVSNAAAANSMNVFPQTGEAINALGANAAFALAANKSAEFTCAVAGQWHAVLTA